jgi:CO dehydrogenase/acetyl-CoA synthase gamma subunit (corrinoid Fe-S protein)
MNYLKLKLDDDTYQYLKVKFDGDINAIEDFVKKILSKEIEKIRLDPNDLEKKNINDNLENYLKSGKSGSRSYGIKGQGW